MRRALKFLAVFLLVSPAIVVNLAIALLSSTALMAGIQGTVTIDGEPATAGIRCLFVAVGLVLAIFFSNLTVGALEACVWLSGIPWLSSRQENPVA